MLRRTPLCAIVAVLGLTGCSGTAPSEPATTAPRHTASSLPSELHVTCSTRGIAVDQHEIQTRPTGVVLVVTSTLPNGPYLTYRSGGKGGESGGSDLPEGTRTSIKQLAPGLIRLGCEDDGELLGGREAKVRVHDPGGYWRGFSAIDDLGCGVSGVADWRSTFFQEGSTAKGAARAVAHTFSEFEASNGRPGTFTVQEMATGYSGAPVQIWLAEKDGKPHATIRVDHRAGAFHAGALDRCRRA